MSVGSVLNKPKNIWTVIIDISKATDISIEGCSASLVTVSEGTCDVFIVGRFYRHRLVEVKNNQITIYASSGSIIPCYVRIRSNKLYLSNVAANILVENEAVSINTYVLFQNMTGTPYPQSNIFNDITLCEASGIYSVNNTSIVYKGSQLGVGDSATFDDIFGYMRSLFDSYLRDGDAVNLLLSGGYDSRLNLCLALDSASRFGNTINTYHFYKDEDELSITSAVAKQKNLPFVCKKREDYIGEKSRAIIFDDDFIGFHNGNYRDDLPRWHGLLDEMSNEDKNSLTVGLGAEAHKGKYYRHFTSVNDAEAVLGVNHRIVPEICRALGIKSFNKNSQKSFFNELVEHSNIYDRLDQKIDFMHYHTYVSNGWGGRTHDVSSYYSAPFPFVDQEFLNKVFSLPKEQKQDFYITKKMIETLNPNLSKIQYTSGNQYSITNKKKSVKRYIPDIFYKELSYFHHRYLGNTRKGRDSFFEEELNVIMTIVPCSYLTTLLKDILISKSPSVPHIRLNFTLQSFLYLTFLERHKNINLVME
jgi:hypothetical protein